METAKNTNNLPDGTLVSWNAGKDHGRTCGPARTVRKAKRGSANAVVEYMVQPGFFSTIANNWKFGQFPAKLMPARNLTVVNVLPESK